MRKVTLLPGLTAFTLGKSPKSWHCLPLEVDNRIQRSKNSVPPTSGLVVSAILTKYDHIEFPRQAEQKNRQTKTPSLHVLVQDSKLRPCIYIPMICNLSSIKVKRQPQIVRVGLIFNMILQTFFLHGCLVFVRHCVAIGHAHNKKHYEYEQENCKNKSIAFE